MQLPDGYALEPVLTEPNIKEPVNCTFDGNGRMYVIEMRTYMQDADATNEFESTSRISMHEDSNGDGKYDKHHVFIDNLLLPRMVLPLEDGIVVSTTNTHDLYLYKDTNGDGVADQKTLYYTGGARGGNLEHQPSGLIWSLDNWVYSTYNTLRYKFGADRLISTEKTAPNKGQWGLTQDNYGKPWFVNGGSELGPVNYQFPVVYGMSRHFKEQAEPNFRDVWPICEKPDVQGGPRRLREGRVLNHFTATCGQDFFRGDRLPADLQGDLLFAEPVGRLIRRTKIEVNDGVTFIANAYEKNEFIRSTDANFRPVNMVTAPDGTLYIVDMYRGIIQEGAWTKPDSYLRTVIDKYGFDKNIGHGRIYRLVHKDFKRGEKPQMIGANSSELVKHLSHPNGWWRDTAQKILVLRGDVSVHDELVKLSDDKNHLTRCHALWTIEGIGTLTPELLKKALNDEHPRVRRNAIRVAETLIKSTHESSDLLIVEVSKLITDKDPEVVMQVILTSELLKFKNRAELKKIASAHTASAGVQQTIVGLQQKKASPDKLPAAFKAQLKRGEEIYQQLCSSCHGGTGFGTKAGDLTLAPPLAGSETVNGHHEQFVNVVLHGLQGPVNGKTYTAPMLSMKSQSDQWIADIASFVRYDLGNRAGFVSEEDVALIRAKTKNVSEMLTLETLRENVPFELTNKKDWKLRASHNQASVAMAIDGKPKTGYDSKVAQKPEMWFQIEFPELVNLTEVRIDSKVSPNDFPAQYMAEISLDGKEWTTVQKTTNGIYSLVSIQFAPINAKFFRITTKAAKKDYWSIHEMKAFVK